VSRSREIEALVIFRVHRRPAADFVSDKPQIRRDAPDVADFASVVGRALGETAFRPEDRGERLFEVTAGSRRIGLGKGFEVVEEVARHAVHRESEEPAAAQISEIDEDAVLDCFSVGVDADGFAPILVRIHRTFED
jgi:hypothetical protein